MLINRKLYMTLKSQIHQALVVSHINVFPRLKIYGIYSFPSACSGHFTLSFFTLMKLLIFHVTQICQAIYMSSVMCFETLFYY